MATASTWPRGWRLSLISGNPEQDTLYDSASPTDRCTIHHTVETQSPDEIFVRGTNFLDPAGRWIQRNFQSPITPKPAVSN